MGAGPFLDAQKPCRDHLGVVEDERISGPQVLRNVPEGPVLDLTGLPVHDEEPRRRPVSERILRDQLLGEVKIVIRSLKSRYLFHMISFTMFCQVFVKDAS